MKFNYNYLILLLASMFEVNGSITPFGKYEVTTDNDKLQLKMSNHICQLKGMTYDYVSNSCIKGYYLDDKRYCYGENSSERFNKDLNTTLCYYSYKVNPPENDFTLPAVLLPSALSRIEKIREEPLCQYNYYRKIRTFDDSSFFSYELIKDNGGEVEYQKCEANTLLPPPYCRDPCDITYSNDETDFPYKYSYYGFTEDDIDKTAIFSIEPSNYYSSSSDYEFGWCRCNPDIFSPNKEIKNKNNTKDEKLKLKMNNHLCELQGMTYYPEFDACVKSDHSLNNQNNCKGDDRWEEFNKELNSTVCNIKYKVHPPDDRYEVPAVLFPKALQTLTPTLERNTLCRKRYHYRNCDNYFDICQSFEYSSECEGVYPDYPWNGCPEGFRTCENSPFLPPPICMEACDVTYTNEEDGFPASFLKANFTRSQMDTSVKFSIEAIGVQAQTPTYKFGWCRCDPEVSPPKTVPQICCTGDECQGQSSLRRCCVNPVTSATDLLEHTSDELFFYSKEEDGQECVFDLRKYKPQPGKIDILPTNSTILSTPTSTSIATSSPTDVVDVDLSSPQNKLIQKMSEHMCQLQGMKYNSELKSCIKPYPLDIISNCNDPEIGWEEFDEKLNSVVCHVKYELNPPNNNFEIPAVLLPKVLKKISKKSKKPLCKYQSYENTEISQSQNSGTKSIKNDKEKDSKKCENSFLLPPPECQEACDVTYSNDEYGLPASFIDAGFTSSDIDTSVKFSIEAIGMYLETPMYKFGWCRCNPNIKPPTAVKEICCTENSTSDNCFLPFLSDCCTYSTTSYLRDSNDSDSQYLGKNGWETCIYDIRKYKPEPGKIDIINKTFTEDDKPVKTLPGFNPYPIVISRTSFKTLPITFSSKSPPAIPITFSRKPIPLFPIITKTVPKELITETATAELETKTVPSEFRTKTVPLEFRTKTIPLEYRTKIVPLEFRTKTVPVELRTETITELETKTVPTEFITETVTTELETKTVPAEFITETVSTELGTKTVPVEFRTKTVPVELRTKTVPVELRTKTVPVELQLKLFLLN